MELEWNKEAAWDFIDTGNITPASKLIEESIKIIIKEKKEMSAAVAEVKYTCGCGFRTSKESESLEHSEKTGHTQTVSGQVKKGA